MNEGKISNRYSKALFLSAKDKGIVNQVRQDMDYLLELFSLKDVKGLLDSPVIQNPVKRKTLKALLENNIGELSLNLVTLTVDNNRETFLPGIARSFIDLADEYNGITKTTLTTASEISESVKKDIRDLVEKGMNTTVVMKEIIDPDITGGFMLKVEDTFIDGSVKTQLRKIEKELKEDI